MWSPLSRAVAGCISDEPSILVVSWDRIVAEHGAMLYRAAFRVLHHCGDAEDVTQEVLLEAYRKQQVAGTPPDAALLRRMATLRAIDQYRRRPRAGRLDDEVCQSCVELPDRMLERDEQADRLRKEIVRLPQREAQCFLLRHVEGMSNREIAATLGITASAVATAVHKARTKLRAAMALNTSAEELQ